MAQTSADYAVMLSANASATQIELQWPVHVDATEYRIYRKTREAVSWGSPIATLDGTATNYLDNAITTDTYYAYKVSRELSSGITGEGYILSGHAMHQTDRRGTCLLVIDTTITATLYNELYRLKEDISGDGWAVQELHVARDMEAINVREQIISIATADTSVHALFLIGRVPVLYSGNMYPDGHPDHQGAWPADGIYGDIDMEYSDETIDITVATRPENWNVPGDGKYDQNIFKSKLELQVGRVDMFNLPAFGLDEAVLLKRYLDNDHAYRNAITLFEQRALVDDNFGAFAGEAFASSGWRNFGPMVGNTNVQALDFFTSMRDASYVWSYGCGGGWFQGAGGVGSTSDFVSDTTKTAFSFLFGSYFGDWDATDNFLRASLAGGTTLTNAWAGRPHWHVHEMGMGATIGEAAQLTQNNSGTYISNVFPKWTHIALLGDPTLRMYPIAPVEDVTCTIVDGTSDQIEVDIIPGASGDILGYHIFIAQERFGHYTRVTETPITVPYTIDAVIESEVYPYVMVRPVALSTTPSGSFYHMGTGVVDSADVFVSVHTIDLPLYNVYPNPANQYIICTQSATDAPACVQLTDITGAIVLQGYLQDLQTRFDVATLAPGMYICTIDRTRIPVVITR